jgi:tetratricopeptide (TPR) repeat protein
MSVRRAIDSAAQGRDVLLATTEAVADVTAAWDDSAVVDARALNYDSAKPAAARLVVAHAEALSGLDADAWCGPWHLLERLASDRSTGVILHTHARQPIVAKALSAWFDLEVVGQLDETPAPPADVTEEDLSKALELASGGPWLDAPSPMAGLLLALARTGHIGAVWNVPFLARVADDRRFVEPFVHENDEVSAFFAAHEALLGNVGMLEATEYRFHGRQPKDLRVLAQALELPVRQVARVFRIMDRLGVVVNKPLEEGAGARPNLEFDAGAGVEDRAAALADVAAVLACRGSAGEDESSTSEAVAADGPETSGSGLASGLFASLADVTAVEPPEWPPRDPRPEPAPRRVATVAAVPADLPEHLPGLAELARGDLQSARASLSEISGELAAEAGVLGAFRYERIDSDGHVQRRYQVPDEILAVVLRALELEAVPEERSRALLDEEFPDVFAEVPREGLVEVFYDDGDLAGTHRFTELFGRRAFEASRLDGVRAIQAALASGAADEGDPGDEGWQALSDCLRLRDAGDGEAAWEALQRVDVDVELDEVRQEVILLLPEEHEERVALQASIDAEHLRRTLGPILDGLHRSIDARGQEEQLGHESLDAAVEGELTDHLSEFLETHAVEHPHDPGPQLWLGRLLVKQDRLDDAVEAFTRAVDVVENPSRKAEWTFEISKLALAAGNEAQWWRLLRQLLKSDPNPRAVDLNLAQLFDDGVLGPDHAKDLRKLLDRHGGPRRFPKVRERIKPPEEVDDWKKALVGLKLD